MFVALGITLFYIIFVWLIFFKLELLKFNIAWGIVSFWVGAHLLLIFLVALRFFQPFSADSHVVRSTIQIVPKLTQPTILTEVLVEPNTQVTKGDPLYRFDDTVFSLAVDNAKAQLVAAEQNAKILEQDVIAKTEAVERANAQLAYAITEQARYENLVPAGGARQDELDRWNEQVAEDQAGVKQAEANLNKAQLALESQIDGVNTGILQAQAQLSEAEYFLENTTIYAPENGMIVSQQARPGLVVGDIRLGAIASFVTEDNPYLLATFRQQNLKFVEPGQEVEVALDLYPGEILTGKVEAIWWATRQGQYIPSGRLPGFELPKLPGRIAVQISVDLPEGHTFPAGGHAAVAIYTGMGKSFEFLRRINIRLYSFANFIRPLDI
ncbi:MULTISPECIES: HlyD family secretion protein [unclassified Ruegeria]|uniref:HlyD family secretion protein n=1 Tax=unclassified Ruegeria TaxID=2625375 RepID=UPI0014898226|nr:MULTISPECIES: HlyD family secretion protein [unclassified Ruegeria]NOD75169.1 HlyD family efflux transporter periplasmic adaptor subunit [Ruegeria sp. HKCCD4332]NOD87130.1 HlyD family efflux transporter periplasmic adaptor subunit [Ruegeria sp. HKCCD4318]NOE12685.1 HlyD family efflux transporter periplasmic adaptor subunit [Ruegeria sp. HKCCD4318-2]NOG09150.1 HlyD family secretion protein [Ruegeria sp. HKCCD4315]